MNLVFIGALSGFQNDPDLEGYDFAFFSLWLGFQNISEIYFDQNFIESIGNIESLQFIDNPFFIATGNFPNDTNINDLTDRYLSVLNQFIQLLWLSQDNACSVLKLYVYDPQQPLVHYSQTLAVASDCKGEYEKIKISKSDLDKAATIYKKLSSYTPTFKNEERLRNVPLSDNYSLVTSKFNYTDYNEHNNITKALQFLSVARSHAFLPLKITMYVCVLECLFATENQELAHQCSERVAFYLGGNNETIRSNYKLVKKAYGYRSKYLHGKSLEKSKHSFLLGLSESIDKLLRPILYKVIMTDYETFIGKKEKLDEMLMRLIFRQPIEIY